MVVFEIVVLEVVALAEMPDSRGIIIAQVIIAVAVVEVVLLVIVVVQQINT